MKLLGKIILFILICASFGIIGLELAFAYSETYGCPDPAQFESCPTYETIGAVSGVLIGSLSGFILFKKKRQ